jgi:hypothetical protein
MRRVHVRTVHSQEAQLELRTIDLYKGLLLTPGCVMDRARNQFLSRAGLAQKNRVAGSHGFHEIQNMAES